VFCDVIGGSNKHKFKQVLKGRKVYCIDNVLSTPFQLILLILLP